MKSLLKESLSLTETSSKYGSEGDVEIPLATWVWGVEEP